MRAHGKIVFWESVSSAIVQELKRRPQIVQIGVDWLMFVPNCSESIN